MTPIKLGRSDNPEVWDSPKSAADGYQMRIDALEEAVKRNQRERDETRVALDARTEQLHRAWQTIEALNAEVKELLR